MDASLLLSVVGVESAGKAFAVRYEPHYRWTLKPYMFAAQNNITEETELLCQKTSWGLCQVMGAVAREHGHNGLLTELVVAETGLKFGAIHLRRRCLKHPSLGDVFATYNAGSPRKQAGKYFPASTHAYVSKAMHLYDVITKLKVI